MPSSSGGAGSKGPRANDSMFVFKGTISPNAKVNTGEEPKERKAIEQAIVVAVPKLA